MAVLQSDGINHTGSITLRQNGTIALTSNTTSLSFPVGSFQKQNGNAVFEFGNNLSGDRNCIIDFHSTGTPESQDFNTRIERLGGANGNFQITQQGTGKIQFRNATPTVLAESDPSNGNFGIFGSYFGSSITLSNGNIINRSDGNRHLWFETSGGTPQGLLVCLTDRNMLIQSRNGSTVTNEAFVPADSALGVSANLFRHGASGGRLRMNTTNFAEFHWNNGFYYRIDFNSYVLINASPSDLSFKTIEKRGIDSVIDKVKSLSPVRFSYKEDCPVSVGDNNSRYGFIAQELREILPELVIETGKPKDIPEDPYEIIPDPGTFLAYAQDADKQLIAILTSALQNVISRIEILEAKLV